MTVNVVARQEKMWYDTWADKAKVNMQRYRSGHNGADSKSVWSNPRGFESHPLRQKKARERGGSIKQYNVFGERHE